MLDNIIRLFSITLCSLYTFTKISHKTSNLVLSKRRQLLLLFILVIVSILLNIFLKDLTYFIPIILFWIAISQLTAKPQQSFIEVTISFTISLGAYCLMSFLSTFVMYLLFPNKDTFPYTLLAILSSMLQFVTIHLLCKTKRFKRGMPFLSNYKMLNIATIICIILAISSIYLTGNHHTFQLQQIGFYTTVIALTFLIYWWQAQITKSYRRSLELREQESKRIADLEKDILLQKVLKENERLAHITHRDNTLITTLKNATLSYLSTDYSDEEEALKARDELIANIEALSAGRASLPDNYNEKQARTFDTNFTLLNKLLHQMDADAIQQNIMFSVHFGVMLDEFVPRDISEMDLVHTVDDLLKNAFKATRNSEPRMVQLQFYRLGKHFVVEVADNGIPFEVRSLVNMGLEKLTTYEDGSGIGLVDIWSTKEKCGATYHLEEYVTPSPFSKKISLTFDKKNRYSIRTWRKDEILQMSRRADLQVYEHME